jgi:aspartate 1-decarboxylase
MRWVMRSKIHKATVTQADLNYVGSITLDQDLMDAVGLWPGEKVLVVSNTSGARLETYTIAGERGRGDVCVNGAAAHLIGAGEEIIVMGFELTSEPVAPRVVLVTDRHNRNFEPIVEEPLTEI